MKTLDQWLERTSRSVARHSSRRGFVKKLGLALAGGAAVPLLPVAKAAAQVKPPQDVGDPTSCDYWRYCAVDGFLCSCCGGSHNICPPGTEMSTITWIGTCKNPVDGRHYVISYNDCCGKTQCGTCLCQRDENDRPLYRADKSNDINWCLGSESSVYHCSTAVVVGVALDQ